jgi:predicted transcriptional regulator of viral defense system
MASKKAEDLFRQHGGQLRMSQALEGGTSRSVLYSLRDKGIIVQVSRGLYRLAELPEHREPDLCIVSLRYPRAVICLISALAYHDMTTQVPHEVSIALPRGCRAPSMAVPPVRHFFFSGLAYEAGIKEHDLDGVKVRVYDREKTLADVFRFRNKLGLDVFLEALKLYKDTGNTKPALLMDYARICDVEKAMRPYLEAGL